MTVTPLASKVLEGIRRHALLRDGGRVLVALSGGADSVALLFLLRELEEAGALTVSGVAHLNHQLRGADSDADEAFCRALAGRLGLQAVVEREDVATVARREKRSIEDAARSVRYAFLERAAASAGADAIAVGHTLEDQAETFLLRLLRGAGTRGLAAIHPKAGRIIRPLIDVERAGLRAWLADRGESFREDASNADVAFARNRVRHELIPLLQSRFSAAVTNVLAREAELARQDEEFLAAEAIKLAARIVLPDVAGVTIDADELGRAPRALSSRVAHAVLQRFAGTKSIHFEHVERLLALTAGQAISLPGQWAVRVRNEIRLRPDGPQSRRSRAEGAAKAGEGGNSFAFSLSIPGEVALAHGFAVGAELLPGPAEPDRRPRKWAARGTEVGVAASAVQLPLGVRSRRPGDRFRPLGAPGKRKLQDFLVDRKVARNERDTVPLVVDGRDRIVWVVGHTVAEDFRVTDPSQGVILLKVRHLGGPG